jgi:hypothetical protein
MADWSWAAVVPAGNRLWFLSGLGGSGSGTRPLLLGPGGRVAAGASTLRGRPSRGRRASGCLRPRGSPRLWGGGSAVGGWLCASASKLRLRLQLRGCGCGYGCRACLELSSGLGPGRKETKISKLKPNEGSEQVLI